MAAKNRTKGRRSANQLAKLFRLDGRVAVITGGAGLLGRQHAMAVEAFGGIPVIADIDLRLAKAAAREIGPSAVALKLNITDPEDVARAARRLVKRFGHVDILINNAARNPKVEPGREKSTLGRFEELDVADWQLDLAVGLTGAMLCSRCFGEQMARQGNGVILNIASDLGVIAPNQGLYHKEGLPEEEQVKKPVSYSVVKSGLVGLTRYLATYWADRGVRANAICPGGVENGQPQDFLERIGKLIPMGRMARVDEYQGAIAYMCSDASSYMNGSVVSIDGGRTCW